MQSTHETDKHKFKSFDFTAKQFADVREKVTSAW